MRQGNFLKEKKEYVIEKFQSREGLVDFFVGSAIWAFLIINYNKIVFDYLFEFFKFIPVDVLRLYASYLTFGIFTTILGFAISYTIIKLFNGTRKNFRNFVK